MPEYHGIMDMIHAFFMSGTDRPRIYIYIYSTNPMHDICQCLNVYTYVR